jgi:hypothetical protein
VHIATDPRVGELIEAVRSANGTGSSRHAAGKSPQASPSSP